MLEFNKYKDFIVPKLKYKGKSIEFQRVKGKKAPTIQTLDSKDGDKENDTEQDLNGVISETTVTR